MKSEPETKIHSAVTKVSKYILMVKPRKLRASYGKIEGSNLQEF